MYKIHAITAHFFVFFGCFIVVSGEHSVILKHRENLHDYVRKQSNSESPLANAFGHLSIDSKSPVCNPGMMIVHNFTNCPPQGTHKPVAVRPQPMYRASVSHASITRDVITAITPRQ